MFALSRLPYLLDHSKTPLLWIRIVSILSTGIERWSRDMACDTSFQSSQKVFGNKSDLLFLVHTDVGWPSNLKAVER